jgi:putative transcriptional regulator
MRAHVPLLATASPLLASLLANTLPVPVLAARQPGREVTVRQLAAGTLLIASRNLPDPNFNETVVLLIEYGPGGAAGLVLTRPSEVPLSRVLPDIDPAATLGTRVFIGGPVSTETVLALSRGACDGCREVTRGVFLVNDGAVLRARLATGDDDRRLRVYAGYAGWSAEQLEREVRQDAWRVVDGDASIVFDRDPSTLWRRMLARAESLLAHLGAGKAGVPGDAGSPSWNLG